MVSRFSAENKLREARRDWLATLVRVPANEVIEAANGFDFNVVTLKGPEVGLLMTNGRIHSTGRPFHLGEVSLTKCVLRDGQGYLAMGTSLGEISNRLGRSHCSTLHYSGMIRLKRL